MLNDLICQISVFGDFSYIVPDTDTIKKQMEKLAPYNMIPSVFQESIFSPIPGVIVGQPIDRLQMLSRELNINIMFASNRVDISKTFTASTENKIDNPCIETITKILNSSILGQFTRIAFNTTSLLNDTENKIISKFQPNISYFNTPDELTVRVNKCRSLSFGEHNESVNFITTIQKGMGPLIINRQAQPFEKATIIQFDINTSPIAQAHFSNSAVLEFCNSAESVRKSIIATFI